MRNLLRNTRGSVILAALLVVTVLSIMAGNAFLTLQQRYLATNQTMAWQEALIAAESGIDIAMSEIRIAANGNAESAWDEEKWELDEESGARTYESAVLIRDSEGGSTSQTKITVTAPPELVDARGEQWYLIRSTGIAGVPGQARVAGESVDVKLRRIFMKENPVTNMEISAPEATRVVEVVAKPIGVFAKALVSDGRLDMNNHNIVIDSYDSFDSTKSTNGKYDPLKRQDNGDIATNGTIIDAGSAHIYGDASTNGGDVLGDENVTGEIRDDFYQELPYVRPPDWSLEKSIRDNPEDFEDLEVDGDPAIQATTGDPERVFVKEIDLKKTFTIKGVEDPAGTYIGSDGKKYTKSYVEIVIQGDIAIGGNGEIVLEPGVFARIFIEGNGTIAGNGFANPGSALNLQLYGTMTPEESEAYESDGTEPAERTLKIAGNGGFCGSVYAPMHDIEMKGGGTEDSVFGAFIGNSVFMNGVQSIHYDEALSNSGLIGDYRIISWVEDIAPERNN